MSVPDNVEGLDADLQRLAGEVAAVDALGAEGGAAGVEAQAQVVQDETVRQVEELKGLLQIVSGLFVPMFPKLAEIYTDQTCGALAMATIPVMQKHGWTTGDLMGKWGPEIGLLSVAAPVGIATYQVIAEAREEAKKKEKEQAETRPVTVEKVVEIPLPQAQGVTLERG